MIKAIFFVLACLAIVAQARIPNDGSRTGTCTANSAAELAPPSFTAGGSSLSSDHLILKFAADEHFASLAFQFASGSDKAASNGYCNHVATNANPAPGATWVQEETVTGECDGVTFVADFTDPRQALGKCFDYDNTTDPNYVYYTAIVKVTTTQNRPNIRTVEITRTTTTALQLRFRFQRFITVNSTTVTVVGNPNVKSDVILQEFDTTTEYTTIRLYTSVQRPYNLTTISADVQAVNSAGYEFVNYNDGTPISMIYAGNANYNNGQTASAGYCDAVGVNNAGTLTFTGATSPTACVQVWEVKVRATSAATCKFDFSLTFNFRIFTTSDYLGGAGLAPGEPNFHQKSFTVATNDYCAKIVDNISLSGTLVPYGNPVTVPSTNTQTALFNYLFGQTVYFLANVIPSSGPKITQVSLVRATVKSISEINQFEMLFDHVGNPLPANNPYEFSTNSYGDSQDPNNVNNPFCIFKFLINEQTVLLDNLDVAQTVEVSATFRVDYENLGASSDEIELSSAPRMRLSANGKAGLDLKVDMSITRPSSTASGSSSLVAMVAGIAAGCVALTAFVALFLYRRATNKFVEQASAPVDPKELEALERRLEGTAV